MFSRGFLLTFTFHCYREGAISNIYLLIVCLLYYVYTCPSAYLFVCFFLRLLDFPFCKASFYGIAEVPLLHTGSAVRKTCFRNFRGGNLHSIGFFYLFVCFFLRLLDFPFCKASFYGIGGTVVAHRQRGAEDLLQEFSWGEPA